MEKLLETDLYGPVKALFEARGFEVKGEIGASDIMAVRADDDPVIIELKLGFSLTLLHQAIARQSITERVYVAVPKWKGKAGWRAFKRNIGLCQRLGLGVIAVDVAGNGADIRCDPAPFFLRKSKSKKAALRAAFERRKGDPNRGGAMRSKLVTSYRQEAQRCALYLLSHGPSKGADVAKSVEVAHATRLMADNYHGWFVRIGRGIYDLSQAGREKVIDLGAQKE
ncbi:DUF2161 domain-containing phosphodiesterase [Rhodobacteraceae bacterium nBUS_22]